MGPLSSVAVFIVAVTLLVMFVATIWLVVQAFREHFLWGLGMLLLPLVWVAFVVLNWDRSGRPFLLGLGAAAALAVEIAIAGGISALFGG